MLKRVLFLFCIFFYLNIIFSMDSENYWKNLLEIGNEYMKNEMYQDAIISYKEILENTPNIPELYNNIGVAYQKLGDSEKALNNFMKALELEKDFPEALNNIASLYIKNDISIDIAFAYVIKALSLKEESSFYDTLARIYEKKNMLYKAVENYQTAISKNPDNEITYIRLCKVLIDMKKYDQAMDYIKALMDNGFKGIDAYLIKASILKKIGQYADSHVALMEIINNYNKSSYSIEDEKKLMDEISSYFKTSVWTAALSYYRIINPDDRNYTVEKIKPYTKVFYPKDISFQDNDGTSFIINRKNEVESLKYGVNPDLRTFTDFFAMRAREIFEDICKKNQEIIKIALYQSALRTDEKAENLSIDDILEYIPEEVKCIQKGKYIIINGEVYCTLHGNLH